MKSTAVVIPPVLRAQMEADPEYKTCALYGHFGHTCEGRITWEHAMIAAGKRVQAKWAIIPLCAKAHEVDEFQDAGTMDKEINHWIALSRASDQDLLALFGENEYTPLCKAKATFQQKAYLQNKYGIYERKYPPVSPLAPTASVAPAATTESVSPETPKPLAEKKPWYLCSERDKAFIIAARQHHAKVDGVYYTDWAMISEMIRSYAISLDIIAAQVEGEEKEKVIT